jgi:hypothetical protein
MRDACVVSEPTPVVVMVDSVEVVAVGPADSDAGASGCVVTSTELLAMEDRLVDMAVV